MAGFVGEKEDVSCYDSTNCYNMTWTTGSPGLGAYAQISKVFTITTTGWHNASIRYNETGMIGEPYVWTVFLINDTQVYSIDGYNTTDSTWNRLGFYFNVASGNNINITIRMYVKTAFGGGPYHFYMDALSIDSVTGNSILSEPFDDIASWTEGDGTIGTGLADSAIIDGVYTVENSTSSWQGHNLTQALAVGTTDYLLNASVYITEGYGRLYIGFLDSSNVTNYHSIQAGWGDTRAQSEPNYEGHTRSGSSTDYTLSGRTNFIVTIMRSNDVTTILVDGYSWLVVSGLSRTNFTHVYIEMWDLSSGTGVMEIDKLDVTTFSTSSSSTTLDLTLFANDGSTLTTDLSSTYITLVNNTGTFSLAVSSGVLNLTGLTINSLQNITVQIYNTTNSNSFVKVNSSDMVSINATEALNRDLVLSVYQGVTWSFVAADSTSFTPSFFEVTLGNNGTQANLTSSSVFTNGSNTINRMYWHGGNVKNSTTTFEVSSDAQALVFEGGIVNINLQGRGITDTALSNIKYDVILANGTILSSLSADSNGLYSLGYIGNGTNTITSWWMNIIGNDSLSYSPTTDETLTIFLTVYKDDSSLSRYGLNQTALTSHSVANEEISFTASASGSKVLIMQILSGAYTGIDSYSLNGSSTSGGDSSVANGVITNITISFTSPFDILVKLRSGGGGGGAGDGDGGGGGNNDASPEEPPPRRGLGEEVAVTSTTQQTDNVVNVPVQTAWVLPILFAAFFGVVFFRLYLSKAPKLVKDSSTQIKDRFHTSMRKTDKLLRERKK